MHQFYFFIQVVERGEIHSNYRARYSEIVPCSWSWSPSPVNCFPSTPFARREATQLQHITIRSILWYQMLCSTAQVTHSLELCLADIERRKVKASSAVETRRPHLTPHVCTHISNFALLFQMILRRYLRYSPGHAAEYPEEKDSPCQ